MSLSRRAWIVAASVGAVEALKDQVGFCRWNYPLRNLAQHTKNNIRSLTQAKKFSSSPLIARSEKAEQSEESLRKVISTTSANILHQFRHACKYSGAEYGFTIRNTQTNII
ncbi:hypothetical protein HAX54_049864 [Datura stramonium]|uniref:Wound induced protein n=1 Tax=Datura stramonium TaxID=4076 RepID=A0ABS8WKV2_DATST|nr:hypothetical protein [Datura stramonium]